MLGVVLLFFVESMEAVTNKPEHLEIRDSSLRIQNDRRRGGKGGKK
ncbi:hypothetical protein [Neobacillus drentensis]|nr:hypothetical protein [Neobacillus drentensis]